MKSARVLVVGDIMLDEYIIGDATRMSPEAPVPVLLIQEKRLAPGGAANVAMNVAKFGAKCTLIGVIGNDGAEHSFAKMFDESNVNAFTFCPVVFDGRPTTRKSRIMARGQQLIRVDEECHEQITGECASMILNHVFQNINEVDVCILSDYGKGVLTDYVCEKIFKVCESAGVKTIVDPSGCDWGKYDDATIIKPNAAEFKLVGEKKVFYEHLCDYMVVTQGANGVDVYDLWSKEEATHYSSIAKEIYDVTGAGDTFAAFMAMALAVGKTVDQAVVVGNAAAGVSVGKLGASTVDAAELEAALGLV